MRTKHEKIAIIRHYLIENRYDHNRDNKYGIKSSVEALNYTKLYKKYKEIKPTVLMDALKMNSYMSTIKCILIMTIQYVRKAFLCSVSQRYFAKRYFATSKK